MPLSILPYQPVYFRIHPDNHRFRPDNFRFFSQRHNPCQKLAADSYFHVHGKMPVVLFYKCYIFSKSIYHHTCKGVITFNFYSLLFPAEHAEHLSGINRHVKLLKTFFPSLFSSVIPICSILSTRKCFILSSWLSKAIR